jgi:phage-related protein (TIGR01555 family)
LTEPTQDSNQPVQPSVRMDRTVADGLSEVLTEWSTLSGAASPGGIEPAYYLDRSALDDLYRANTYAQRLCDAMPDEATRRGFEVTYGEQDEDEKEQGDPIGDELWRLGFREQLNHAGKLARKDGLAALYIGVNDGQDVQKAVDEERIQRVTHLTLVERDQLQPYTWQNDFTKPGFGEPEVYQITPYSSGGATTGAQGGTAYVHRSRLLLLGGKWLPPRLQAENNSSHDSVLQRCWRLVQDFRRTEGDIGVLLRSYSHGVYKLPQLASLLSTGNNAKVIERVQLVNLCRQILGLAVIGEGEEISYVTRSVAGLADLYDRLAQGLSAAAEMPLTLLFGHAPSGLSTDDSSGRTYWYARVASYQQNELQPHIEYIGHLCALAKQGPCKGREPERWEVAWRPLTEPTEAELVEMRNKQAATDKTYWEMEVLSAKEIRQSRFGRGSYSVETTLIESEDPTGGDGAGGEEDPAAAAEARAEAEAAAKAEREARAAQKTQQEAAGRGDAASEPADYFRNVGGVDMPFQGDPGAGVPVGGPPAVRAALAKSPATQKALAAKQAAAKPKKLSPKAAAKAQEQAREELGRRIAEKNGSLNEKHVDAIQTYSGSSYENINASLRGGKPVDPSDLKPTMRNMDAAFKSDAAVLSETVETYRGMNGTSPVAEAIRSGQLEVGGTIQDRGFVSTTIDPSVASGFVRTDTGMVMKITAPAGSRGIYMGAGPPQNLSAFSKERELLLDRGSKFRITKIEDTKDKTFLSRGIKQVVHCEVVN